MKPLYTPFAVIFSCLAMVLFLEDCNGTVAVNKNPLSISPVYDTTDFSLTADLADRFYARIKMLDDSLAVSRLQEIKSHNLKGILDNDPQVCLCEFSTVYYKLAIYSFVVRLSEASTSTVPYVPSLTPSANGIGGRLGKNLLDENGVCHESLIMAGIEPSCFYNRTLSQLLPFIRADNSPSVQKEAHKYLNGAMKMFGMCPSFPSSDDTSKHSVVDRGMARVAAMFDDGSGDGYYSQAKNAFLKANSAVKAGTDYQLEVNEAVSTIRHVWEKTIAGLAIRTLNKNKALLSKGTLTDDEKGQFLFNHSQAIGLIYGWERVQSKIISDEKIRHINTILGNKFINVPSSGTDPVYEQQTMSQFLLDAPKGISNYNEVVAQLALVYELTPKELASFDHNFITELNR